MRRIVLGVVLAAVFPASAAAQALVRGPHLGKAAADGVTVRFILDAAAAAEIEYGPTDSYGATAAAGSGTIFEVPLEGLGPGATVHYRVRAGGVRLGEDHAFRTAPAPRAPFRMMVFGDTRSDHEAHRGVIAQAVLQHPWVAVNTGDLVSAGDIDGEWTTFFEVEAPLIADVPLFPAAGNHENTDESDLYFDSLPLPENSPRPERYYSFDYGNVHGIVLDQYVNIDPEYLCIVRTAWWETCMNAEQRDWLEGDLDAAAANPDIDHVFVFAHEGPYSSKEGRDGSHELRGLLDMFLEHGVRAVMTGHDHYYERGFAPNGLLYVVTGGGGAPLYEPDSPTAAPHTVEAAESVHHFVILDLNGLDVTLTAYRADGSILDTYAYSAPPRACADPATDCGALPPSCTAGRWDCVEGACAAVDCAGGPDAGTEPDGEAGGEPGADADAPPGDLGAGDADAAADPGGGPDGAPDVPADGPPDAPPADVVADAPGPGEGAGCGCRLVEPASGGPALALALLAAAMAALRRRR